MIWLPSAASELILHLRVWSRMVITVLAASVLLVLGSFTAATGALTVAGHAAAAALSHELGRPRLRGTAMEAAPHHGVTYVETTRGGDPLRVPCRVPVVIVYDPSGQPYVANALIGDAAQFVSAAAGVHVQVRTGQVTRDAPVVRGWVQVRVMWQPALPTDSPGSETLGEGGPIPAPDGIHLAGGEVILAASAALPLTTTAGGELGPLLHEFGHALDLGHVADPVAAMYPVEQLNRPPGYDLAEQAALRWIGTSDCSRPNPNTSRT